MTSGRPLHLPQSTTSALLQQVLARGTYEEAEVCRRLGLRTLDSVDHPPFKALATRVSGTSLFDILCRLFLFGATVPSSALTAVLHPHELDAFVAADLLRVWDAAGPIVGEWYAPVRLVPVHTAPGSADLQLVGDRGDHPDGSAFIPFPDIVFSGHNPLTRQFLRLLPGRVSGTLLDLCGGTGVAALACAARSTSCVTADIAERSSHFARFNAWLNGVDNVEVVCGDLYHAVHGRRFDRIAAHPPYVPALTQELTYRDGGQSGEAVIEGIVRGVPAHLNVGGSFHLLCLGMDTTAGTFEQRARAWLGDAAGEFDIVFALDSRTAPEQIATRLIERSGASTRDLGRWRELFERLQVQEFVYGALVGRRFEAASSQEPMTRRVVLTEDSTCDGFDWLFAWFDWLRQPDLRDRVMALRPSPAPDLSLEVRHTIKSRGWEPDAYTVANGGRPFLARLEPEPWVVALIGDFDGVHTIDEVFRSASARGRVPADFDTEHMSRLACYLLERGCLLADRGQH